MTPELLRVECPFRWEGGLDRDPCYHYCRLDAGHHGSHACGGRECHATHHNSPLSPEPESPAVARSVRVRHRPTETVAAQYRVDDKPALAPPGVFFDPPASGLRPYVITIHGTKTPITDLDWIVREPDGRHYYPCKPDVFLAHYEVVQSDVPAITEAGDGTSRLTL